MKKLITQEIFVSLFSGAVYLLIYKTTEVDSLAITSGFTLLTLLALIATQKAEITAAFAPVFALVIALPLVKPHIFETMLFGSGLLVFLFFMAKEHVKEDIELSKWKVFISIAIQFFALIAWMSWVIHWS